MKIASVSVSLLRVALPEPYVAAGRVVDANWHVLAEVETTDGVRGFGYVVALREMFCRAVASAARELGTLVVGLPVSRPEDAWQRMARAGVMPRARAASIWPRWIDSIPAR